MSRWIPSRNLACSHALSAALLLCTLVVIALGTFEQPAVLPFPMATVIEGQPRERGRAYGTMNREAIRDFLQNEIYAAFIGKPSSKEQLLEYAAACLKVVLEECPNVADEFQGIAEGAGLSFPEIILTNLHEELYHRTELPKQGHCTAVAVAPPDTGSRHTYVGQTWDWMQTVAGKSRVMEWRRPEGVSVLAYGFPGMPMGAGVNSAGLALCWTSASLGKKGQAPRVGIPSYLLIAHLLAQKDLERVVREARKNRHAGWFTFVMADGHGNLLNIEGSPDRIAIEPAQGRLARVDYGSREMTGVKTNERIPLQARCQHMYELLGESRGKNDLARLQDYFADRQHQINMGKATIDMMVFDTTARTAYLSRGSSYQLSWREFKFVSNP
jgi:hypothetical protein